MEMAYDENVFQSLAGSVRAHNMTGVQVNLGRFCNLSCEHCHLEASPARTEMMDWNLFRKGPLLLVDIALDAQLVPVLPARVPWRLANETVDIYPVPRSRAC